MLRPLGGRVLLQRPPVAERIGSIIIPERSRMIPQEGVVMAVTQGSPCAACGHVLEPTVRVGETVLHGRYSRLGLPDSYGERMYLIWERDAIAVLDPA